MGVNSKPYWHEASEEEVKAFMETNPTWGDLMEKFQQPSWCTYEDALKGEYGCWSLTNPGTRTMICPAFCKDCDCFKE